MVSLAWRLFKGFKIDMIKVLVTVFESQLTTGYETSF